MRHRILTRSAVVLIIEPSLSLRKVMSECITKCGFTQVSGLPTCADARSYFESGQRADWVLAPLGETQGAGAAALLLSIAEVPTLADVAFTLLVRGAEKASVPLAFEFGALSWQQAAFTRDSFSADIEALLLRLDRCQSNVALVAATYLARNLLEAGDAANLLQLSGPIMDMNPGAGAALLVALLARIAQGDPMGARALAAQWRLLEPHADSELRVLAKEYPEHAGTFLGEAASGWPANGTGGPEPARAPNVLDLHGACVIVDPDRDARELMRSLLEALGAPSVVCFEDGSLASEWLASNIEPSLVIQEWRIPGLSGPFLLQRLRELGHTRSPVIVVSSLVKKQDAILLREMGVSSVLPKPFERTSFLQTIMWSLQQTRSATEYRFLERQIALLFDEGRKEEGMRLAKSVLSRPGLGEAARLSIEARIAYSDGKWKECVEEGMRALHLAPDTLSLLNLLAKALLRAGDSTNALRFLERAQALSPLNLERLCFIAQVSAEAGDHERARTTLDKARALDPHRGEVLTHDASNAIERGDTHAARAALSRVPHLNGLLASINNKAVALSRSGQIPPSIRLYRDLMASIPEERHFIKAAVEYNLALAYVRNGDLAPALECVEDRMEGARFETMDPTAPREKAEPTAGDANWERLSAKRRSLRLRVARAVEKREASVALNTADCGAFEPPVNDEVADLRSAASPYRNVRDTHQAIAEIAAGSGFLRRVFRCQGEAAKSRAALFAEAPRFYWRNGPPK